MGVYDNVAGLRPNRSVFNLSYEKKLTCDMGQLIPIMCEEVVPGDTFKVANEIVIRMQPLIAPIMHEVFVYTHYFFVPYRILDENFEDFITGGVDGTLAPALARWVPSEGKYGIGSLWDFFGFPVGVIPGGKTPLAFPKRAYNLVWNEYYRDETLQDEVDLDSEEVLNRCWEKDYFTSALPWQQRGTAPALPISGTTSAIWSTARFINGLANDPQAMQFDGSVPDRPNAYINAVQVALNNARAFMNTNTVDLSAATTFDVADLRLVFQIQKFLERNARAGARYVEFVPAHFGVRVPDYRLQRPEYIGGTKSPMIISEVLKTGSTDAISPQGNLAGHGITANTTYAGSYTATEFGCIIGIMSVIPRSVYQQGVPRQWLRETRYDFYFPEFANLSEQPVYQAEIFAMTDSSENNKVFGYQGRYNEMRSKQSMVCGLMRTDLNHWTMARIFDEAPLLNENLVECIPTKRIYAVPSQPGLIVNVGNIIKAIRPMPVESNPGLIDHS